MIFTPLFLQTGAALREATEIPTPKEAEASYAFRKRPPQALWEM